MIGLRDPLRALVAREDDLEQFDHDLAVDLGQMVQRQKAIAESGD
jgi:hypothetical protein